MWLRLLADDRSFFARYDADLLYRLALASEAPAALEAMLQLAGRVDEHPMIHASAAVAIDKVSSEQAARDLLAAALGQEHAGTAVPRTVVSQLGRDVVRHLELVGASLSLAILFGISLGILAARSRCWRWGAPDFCKRFLSWRCSPSHSALWHRHSCRRSSRSFSIVFCPSYEIRSPVE
jgi:Substrate binding domain of ABC-type glycine betaine transport system